MVNIKDLYRDDLLTAAKHPDNMGLLDHPDMLITEYNTSCGDQVTVSIKLDKLGKKVVDIKWQGNGCLVSQTAMSQVSNLVKGQTLVKIQKLNLKQLLKAMNLLEISPARQRCAELGLTAVQKVLAQNKKTSIKLVRKPDYIFVGSQNPVKVQAVAQATSSAWPQAKVIGISVPSSVGEQPRTDLETRTGSAKRAQAVLQAGLSQVRQMQNQSSRQILGIGLEGGVFTDSKGQLWSTVWARV